MNSQRRQLDKLMVTDALVLSAFGPVLVWLVDTTVKPYRWEIERNGQVEWFEGTPEDVRRVFGEGKAS